MNIPIHFFQFIDKQKNVLKEKKWNESIKSVNRSINWSIDFAKKIVNTHSICVWWLFDLEMFFFCSNIIFNIKSKMMMDGWMNVFYQKYSKSIKSRSLMMMMMMTIIGVKHSLFLWNYYYYLILLFSIWSFYKENQNI